MSGNDRLTARQKKALRALLSCSTVRAAAKRAGVGEATIHRYLHDPQFKAELRARQDELMAATVAGLTTVASESIGKLGQALDLLAEHMGANLADFITVDERGRWALDLAKTKAAGKLGLLKELDYDKDGNPRIKVHDSQTAARALAGLVLSILDERRKVAELEELTSRVAALERR